MKCSEVSFIGHVMTRNGLKADPKKVEAIIKMEQPADVPAAQRFIGLVKYLSNFLHTYQNCVSHCTVEHTRKLSGIGLTNRKMPLRRLKMLSPKRQCSSTAVRVTHPKAKGMHLQMDLALY